MFILITASPAVQPRVLLHGSTVAVRRAAATGWGHCVSPYCLLLLWRQEGQQHDTPSTTTSTAAAATASTTSTTAAAAAATTTTTTAATPEEQAHARSKNTKEFAI